jgi:hypothetical protein
MIILDPGHIYKLDDGQTLKFVKRGGGAIQYPEEWPGIQTQAVMRSVIDHLWLLEGDIDFPIDYDLWQLGTDETAGLTLTDRAQICDVIKVLSNRSNYLNAILECAETKDSICFLNAAHFEVSHYIEFGQYTIEGCPIDHMRMALWNYEARAYRRKQEKVNREAPTHDDSQRLKAWRYHPAADVPFGPHEIERRPIGLDGHIVLET